jgi:ABC-2 type transport system ATP-binding protein
MRRVGSLIETPSIYGHLTAEDNLEVWRKLYGCSRDRIDIVLEAVGLATVGAKRAGRFSLGMKQRLGIAVALLHAPELLILDEPTNGLDPGGIVEVRELLLRLNREHGVTIVVSSHLLWEMQKLVTHTGIIHQGRLLYQGPLAGLVGSPASAETSAGEVGETGEAGDGDLESIFIKLTQNNKKR